MPWDYTDASMDPDFGHVICQKCKCRCDFDSDGEYACFDCDPICIGCKTMQMRTGINGNRLCEHCQLELEDRDLGRPS